MSLTYTTVDTEDLGDDQTRKIRAYEVADAGVALNVQVELTINAPYRSPVNQPVIDKEVFLPGTTLAELSGLSFVTVDTVDLGEGQKRYVRQLTLPSGGKVTSIVGTVDAKQGSQTRTFVKNEELYYHQPVLSAPSYFGAKPPQGTWQSATTVDFASRPGLPATNELVLPDGKLRSMAGTVGWDAARGVDADRGYDHQDSIDGSNKWLWWYVIPMPGDDASMTIVASERPPSQGPVGQSIFKPCWVSRRIGGDILKVQQVGNRFDHTYRDVYADFNINDEDDFTSVSLDSYVPETAAIARLHHEVICYGTQSAQDRWLCYLCSTTTGSAILNLIDIRSPWDTQRSPAELTSIAAQAVPLVPYTLAAVPETTRAPDPNQYMTTAADSFEAPLFGSRTIYKRRDRMAGTQNALFSDSLQASGWVDAWIEP